MQAKIRIQRSDFNINFLFKNKPIELNRFIGNKKKIPVNVEDQIYLWYRERELVVSDNVDVYTDFVDVEEYNAWAEFADKNEILKGQYVDNKKDEKKLLVEDETYPMMKEFCNKRKELQRAGVQTTNDDENANNDDSYMVVDDAEYDEDDD